MSWQTVNAIAEIIGAVAIVISLIYLARQLGQNTQAIKSATWQAIQDAEQRFDESIAVNPDMAELFDKGTRNGLRSLEGNDRTRYRLIYKQLMDMYQTHHYHYENGIIDDDLWQTWVAQLDFGLASTPHFGRDMLPRLKYLRPSFRTFLEARLRDHGIDPADEVVEPVSKPGSTEA